MRSIVIVGLLVMNGSSLAADIGQRTPSDIPLRISPNRPPAVDVEVPRPPRADVFVNSVTAFSTMQEALARCPGEPVVWVPTVVNALHPGRSAIEGAYMCRADASSQFDRPQ